MMKKKIGVLVSLILCMAMLCGCLPLGDISEEIAGVLNSVYGEGGAPARDMLPFPEMEYIRPDIDKISDDVDAVIRALDNGTGLKGVIALLDICFEDYYSFDTMYTIADIRSCMDATDEYYADEYVWCAENYTSLDQLFDDMYYACAASKLGRRLERNYFWEGFCDEYSDPSESYYNDTTVALMQKESDLIAEYREFSACPVIEVDGEIYDFYEYSYDLYGDEYAEALITCQRQANEKYADMFIELIRIRKQLAEEFGYDTYEQMQYDYFFERDYSPEEAARYIADIKEYIVPLYVRSVDEGIYDTVMYQYVPENKLFKAVKTVAESLCEESAEAFSFMDQYELYDISLSDKKVGMSFEVYLADYEAPYLFLSPYGDTSDISSFTHEFGHYMDAYINCNAPETIDVAEVFSQGLEYLALSYYGEALTPTEIDNLTRMKMLDTLDMYVEQASFAEFESRVYAIPEEDLSAETINALMLELTKEYGYCEAAYEDYYSMIWADIAHFWEMPFYVISYPVSNDIAMQMYEQEKSERGKGVEKYLDILIRDYSMFLEMVEVGRFESPFAEGRIRQVAADLSADVFSQDMAA